MITARARRASAAAGRRSSTAARRARSYADLRSPAEPPRTSATLARHLAERGEVVVELDRPVRPARRAGAKSDVIDAERAAREALSRTHLAQPKTGPERAAVQASADAQLYRQLENPTPTP